MRRCSGDQACWRPTGLARTSWFGGLVSGDDAPASATTAPATQGSTSTEGRTPATAPTATTTVTESGSPAAEDLDVTVFSAEFQPATTQRGRARQRGRLAVRLRVVNTGAAASELGSSVVAFGRDRLVRDARASMAAADLAKPIAAGQTALGTLRFETTGGVTARLAEAITAKLRIAGRTLDLKITQDSSAQLQPQQPQLP